MHRQLWYTCNPSHDRHAHCEINFVIIRVHTYFSVRKNRVALRFALMRMIHLYRQCKRANNWTLYIEYGYTYYHKHICIYLFIFFISIFLTKF